MALEHRSVNVALLARPTVLRLLQHMNNRKIQPLFQRIEFLAKRNCVPVLVSVEQDHRPLVTAIGERSDHAHHRGNAHSAGDEDMHICRVAVDGECAVWSIEVDSPSYRYIGDLSSEIT